jgi:hypothetical protein
MAETTPPRKPYQTPRLQVHGDIVSLTHMPNPPGKKPCEQDALSGIGLGATCDPSYS